MGKNLGVKRNRGKKFVYREKEAIDIPKKVKTKSIFRDKRLGEKNENLDKEEKYLLRFQKERELISRRNQKFELDDSIGLTHKGVKLEDLADDYVEDYDVYQSDEDEDLEKPKKHQRIDNDIVSEEHFGGGGGHKSKKDAYAEIIEKSKHNKMLRQKERDENNEIMRDIDMTLGEITGKLKFREKKALLNEDEYDKLIDEIRNDTKLHPANVLSEEAAEILEQKENMERLGENWEVPLVYEEFAIMMGENPLESLGKMKMWNKAHKRASKDKLQKMLEHALTFLVLNWNLDAEFEDEKYDDILRFFYDLCREFPYTSEQTCLELATELGKELSLNLLAFYHLVGMLFEIELHDTLSSILTDMASQFFLYFPFLDNIQTRNFLLLSKIYIKTWLAPNGLYSPECIRGLLRALKHIGPQSYNTEFTPKLLFSDPSDSNLYTFANNLFSLIHTSFSSDPAFGLILSEFEKYLEPSLNLKQEILDSSLRLHIEKPQEIETYEPFILDRITSVKTAKDPNKERTETDKLKMQVKKATKLTKRALQQEAEVDNSERFIENKLIQQKKVQKQGQIRNMLDELQVEYKKLTTSNELKKEKKKRKQRMGGNKTERR